MLAVEVQSVKMYWRAVLVTEMEADVVEGGSETGISGNFPC